MRPSDEDRGAMSKGGGWRGCVVFALPASKMLLAAEFLCLLSSLADYVGLNSRMPPSLTVYFRPLRKTNTDKQTNTVWSRTTLY